MSHIDYISGRSYSSSSNQMRRIVRFIKRFTKSRENCDHPGDMIISVLVAECYISHLYRDDISLYDTLIAIRNRLKYNEDVYNPVDRSQKLTDRPIDYGRTRRLRERLDSAETKLSVLFDSNCDEKQVKDAWFWFFPTFLLGLRRTDKKHG